MLIIAVTDGFLGSNIVWLADTNYRVDLDNDEVRSLAEKGEYDALVAVDQVGGRFFSCQMGG